MHSLVSLFSRALLKTKVRRCLNLANIYLHVYSIYKLNGRTSILVYEVVIEIYH